MDKTPVGFAGDGVDVALAQIAYVVGFFQLLHGARVHTGLSVVETEGTHVLVSTVDSFDFLFATKVLGDFGCGYAERKEDEEDRNDKADEHEALFGVVPVPGEIGAVFFHASRLTAPAEAVSAGYCQSDPRPE